ncbi:MAG: hypothetical protein JSW25_05800 [Thermoplasmata archaeon]|nr:MAG: hypothetical protein JSW25_05800 [Thermoplasmata archaeon]
MGIHLQKYSVEMLVSTEQDTVLVIPGWVDVGNMRPGETVSVDITSTGHHYLYAGPDPPHMIFERDGRQYFNLTLTLVEDSPITESYEIIVTAIGKTVLDQAVSDVELVVYPDFQITATVNLVAKPPKVSPGGETTGTLRITNTGSIWGEYRLTKKDDPEFIVERIRFTREAELTPGFHDDFEFKVEVTEDAEPGNHRIVIEVWASTQYDTGAPMDTFTMEVIVEEETGMTTGTLLALTILVIAFIGVATFLLRRKD